jgi:hypothetical protein
MKKLLSIVLFLGIFFSEIHGQKGSISVMLGPSMSFVIANENFSYYFKNGIGGIVQTGFSVSKLGSVVANYSIYEIGSKHSTTGNLTQSFLKFGFNSFFSNSRFFFQADAGLSFNSDNKGFVIGIAPGYSIKLSERSAIDIFPSINQVFGSSSNTWVFANIGYRVKIK